MERIMPPIIDAPWVPIFLREPCFRAIESSDEVPPILPPWMHRAFAAGEAVDVFGVYSHGRGAMEPPVAQRGAAGATPVARVRHWRRVPCRQRQSTAASDRWHTTA